MLRTRRSILAALAAVALLQLPTRSEAENFIHDHLPSGSNVVSVEEDWELVVGEVDPNVTAPQVTTAMSPSSGLSGVHAIFNLNHQALDTFSPGGMQLQLWSGDTPVAHNRLNPGDVLSSNGETITWTQDMTLQGNYLSFHILNGNSDTWGDFGNSRLLTDRVQVSFNNLNNYDPYVSLANSGSVFASNRVDSLVLRRIRLTTSNGNTYTFNVNLSVDQQAD